jgi:hypothetical protein
MQGRAWDVACGNRESGMGMNVGMNERGIERDHDALLRRQAVPKVAQRLAWIQRNFKRTKPPRRFLGG